MSPEETADLNAWRKEVDSFMKDSTLMDHAFKKQLQGMSDRLEENTAMTKSMHDGLGDALPALKDFGGAWRTMKRLGKPLAYLIAFGAAVWTYHKTGEWRAPNVP